MIPLAFVLYSALLSMFSHVKVPVVSRFFSFSAWLSIYDGSFEEVILNIFIAGVVFDLDIVSFFSCIDACLFRDAGMELILFQQNLPLKETSQYSHNHEYATPYYNQFCIKLSLFNSRIYFF